MKNAIRRMIKAALAKRHQVIVPTMMNIGRPRYVDVLRSEYTNDYIRLSQLDLAIGEIWDRHIPGDVAEVGVYRGAFAAVLNRALPDRNLYLFDTFEGFDAKQERHDRQVYGLTHERDFSDTSVKLILGRMSEPTKCVVKKGLFPATARGLEDRVFCFVSLDTDLYEPIKAGLDFFWDRMSPGGFIFVHDYNNSAFPGAKRAVLEFAERRGVTFVPVTDVYGTAIFRR